MQPYFECPQVLRDFLSYHESIKGQSKRTISEYHLDLRMFLRFLTLMRKELPYNTPLDEIDIKWIDASVLDTVSSSEVFDFLSYLTNDRQNREGPSDVGIAAASRARKLSAIFTELGVPHVTGRVWTTDAMIRETAGLVAQRRSEGCLAVEMELAGVQAVCSFYGLALYNFLEAGDVLEESGYDVANLRGANHDLGKLYIALETALRI